MPPDLFFFLNTSLAIQAFNAAIQILELFKLYLKILL